MKYFFDTEFIEDGKTIDLISIGIVEESNGDSYENRTLYLQNSECSFQLASDWVWRNVYPHLIHFDMRGTRSCHGVETVRDSGLSRSRSTKCGNVKSPCMWATRDEIRDAVLDFVNVKDNGLPEFWGYYADYDWVVFCQLFGSMMQLPKGFPMYCRDLKQLLDENGNPRFQKDSDTHHALSDAEWICETYNSIKPRIK